MLKLIYRGIILVAVFIGSLIYFSGDIKEVVFDIDNTTVMEQTTLPVVTISAGDNMINLLHGYSSNLDANKIRETVTPLARNQTFEVLINQENYEIKKLNYEVREFVGNSLVETDSISVFKDDGTLRKAKLKLKAELIQEKEYAVKITLITSESEKIYYYQRIKVHSNWHLAEKLNFVMDFHDAILNKETAQKIVKYLESSDNADNTSLAYVNINSSFDLVSWGNIKPVVLTEVIPEVKEIYEDTASVELNYYVKAEVAGVDEVYQVREFYRVRYSADRMYLLNYERRMESLFDLSRASVTKNEFKLGISSDMEISYEADKTKVAFIRNRELWFYDLEKNEITKVFSFRQTDTDYIRDTYDQHNIRILNMDVEGNMDFMVYGYMNRGQYEGRVAMILYHFVRAENRIEELVYIPVEEDYQKLKEHLGRLSYVNSKDVFYFQVYNTIYSYDLITKKLIIIADGIDGNQVMVLEDIHYIAWQDNPDPKQSDHIYLLDMENGKRETITAGEGYNIRLMGMIDSNIIYGYVEEENIASVMDGSILAPLSTIEIASSDRTVLKSYHEKDYYISRIEVKDNVIELRRVRKMSENGSTYYVLTEPDYIMNQEKKVKPLIGISKRITEQALSEYYMTLPAGFDMKEKPDQLSTVNTVIAEDPTMRLPKAEQGSLYYYSYISGGIAGAYQDASEAISVANDGAGVVLNSNNQIIWERGVKKTKNTITGFDTVNQLSYRDTLQTCLQLVLSYQGAAVTKEQIAATDGSPYEIFKKYSKAAPIRLTGITLEEALYYVSQERPLIAMIDLNDAVVIYGYDTYNVFLYNPASGKHLKMGLQDSEKLFSDAGNIFLSYLE